VVCGTGDRVSQGGRRVQRHATPSVAARAEANIVDSCHMPVAKRKHRSNPQWIARHVNDPYVKAATAHGYRSRAAYKLIEIDERDRLLRPGQVVVDLGAAPGSWSQVVIERLKLAAPATAPAATIATAPASGAAARPAASVGMTVNALAAVPVSTPLSRPPGGRLIAVDLLPVEPLAGADILAGDFREADVLAALSERLQGRAVDVVLSDMAPNLSGIAAVDAARCGHLSELALEFALLHLGARGVLLVKTFQGSGYSQFVSALKRHFLSVAVRKPAASRAESAETYLLARQPRRAAGVQMAPGTGEAQPRG
jgi:23S rRNA (uridine2552-2'-O)-methyltransferase